jgi:hypothetical protein
VENFNRVDLLYQSSFNSFKEKKMFVKLKHTKSQKIDAIEAFEFVIWVPEALL